MIFVLPATSEEQLLKHMCAQNNSCTDLESMSATNEYNIRYGMCLSDNHPSQIQTHFHFDTELNLWMENHVCTHSPTILVFTNACCPRSIVRRDPTIAQITQPLGLWILKRNISTQSDCKICILCCLQHPKNNYSNICVLKIIPAQSRQHVSHA